MKSTKPVKLNGKSHSKSGVTGTKRAIALHGQPETREYVLALSEEGFLHRELVRSRRAAEVAFFIRRPNGKYLLQTKSFYPEGSYRIPTGGIKKREDLTEAVYREAEEETSLKLSIKRFLGILHYRFCWKDHQTDFATYVFLLEEEGGELMIQDGNERISGYREIEWQQLAKVAGTLLYDLPREWEGWGTFRAIVHQFVFEKLINENWS